MKAFGIDCHGGKGMAGFGIDVFPTCAAISHGTPHAVCVYPLDVYNLALNRDGVSKTVNSAATDTDHVPCVVRYKCIIADPLASNSMKSSNPKSGFHASEYAPTLDTSSQNPIRNGGGMIVVQIVEDKR